MKIYLIVAVVVAVAVTGILNRRKELEFKVRYDFIQN